MTDLTNQYTPRTMVDAMRQVARPTTFLYEKLGLMSSARIKRHNTKYIELDKVFGNQLVAGYVNRHGPAHVVGKLGYSNVIHVSPYLKEKYVFTSEDTEVRDPGMTIYDGIANIDAAVMNALNVLRDRFIRVDELQIAQALQTGKITVSGDGVSFEIDFGQDAGHLITLSGTARWTESTSDKLTQIGTWCSLIEDKGAPTPTWMIGEKSAIQNLISDTNVKAFLDNRAIEIGSIRPQYLSAQRATYVGTLTYIGYSLDLYTYQGLYETTDGSTVTTNRYMTTSNIILGSDNADVRKHYCKIENLKAKDLGFRADMFPLMVEMEDGSAAYVQLESAPMVGLHQPNAFVCVTTTSAS